jgi:hypothetical protein
MLDVHPPHAPMHSWKDFFIHIATITIGLLIAVSLEQTVEVIHHHHQLRELNEALQQDNEKALRDDMEVERSEAVRVTWLNARIADVTLALSTKSPAHAILLNAPSYRSLPANPAWRAATTSGLVAIVSQTDIKAFSEINLLIESVVAFAYDKSITLRLRAFEQRFRTSSVNTPLDFTAASRADLLEDLTLLSGELSHQQIVYDFTRYLRGCLEQVLHGERDLDRIDDAENAAQQGPALPPATQPMR